MSQPASIHMGHGQMVDIVPKGEGLWELVFSEAGVPHYKAPPPNQVEVDAIDGEGRIHPLAISAGGNVSRVLASGPVAGAYRARVRVVHGTHFHTRESLLPGAVALPPTPGPHGGAITTLDDGTQIEVLTLNPTHWQLIFLKDGAPVAAPPADAVVAQAVGPRAEDYQIRSLTTEARSIGLIATGKIRDATHARLTIRTEAGEWVRSFPIVAAA